MYVEIGQEILLKTLRIEREIYESYRCQKNLLTITTKSRRLLYISSYHQLCELAPNILKESATTVAILDIKQLQKVRIKKDQNSVTLEFTNDKVYVYEMGPAAMKGFLDSLKDSVEILGMDAVQQCKKPPSSNQAVGTELLRSYLRVVKKLEAEFALLPSMDLVTELMNILRQTVELSAELRIQTDATQVDQQQYKQIIFYIQQFLRRDDVLALIDTNYNAPCHKKEEGSVLNEMKVKTSSDTMVTSSTTSTSSSLATTINKSSDIDSFMPPPSLYLDVEPTSLSPRTDDDNDDDIVIDLLFLPLTTTGGGLEIDINSAQYALDADEDYRFDALESPLPQINGGGGQNFVAESLDTLPSLRNSNTSSPTKAISMTKRALRRQSRSSESLSWMDDLGASLPPSQSPIRETKAEYKFDSSEQATEYLTVMLHSMEKEFHNITQSFSPPPSSRIELN